MFVKDIIRGLVRPDWSPPSREAESPPSKLRLKREGKSSSAVGGGVVDTLDKLVRLPLEPENNLLRVCGGGLAVLGRDDDAELDAELEEQLTFV